MNLEFCRALYNFKSESSIELSLKYSDIIAILKIINKGGGSLEGTENVEELKIN
ncbi:3774_t:CDS:2 [Dentiscutata erythropus]|uniref:3774_t:CDS:1 n=1 Tax=Dentiscutata erythropus TaxID=1348616 RepID=A0A9N9E0H9_9GLOM|nr:3774_t:CDS:2 [Dentiscutata erythropus]